MIEVYVTGEEGIRKKIDHLYWFEQHGVEHWDGEGLCETFLIEVYVDDVLVFRNQPAKDQPA